MTRITPVMTRITPETIFTVNFSPKHITPHNTATTGSRAPKIAAFVAPIFLIASAVNARAITEGKSPSPSTQPHSKGVESSWNFPDLIARKRKNNALNKIVYEEDEQ